MIIPSMHDSLPRIVDRFPRYRDRILRLCVGDSNIADLCEDYDRVLETIEAIDRQARTTDTHERDYGELLKLASQLEMELLDRIDPRAYPDRKAGV